MYREREREREQAVSFDRSTQFLYLFEKSQNQITSGESICRKRKGILYLDTCLESFECSMLAEEYNFKFNVGRSTDWLDAVLVKSGRLISIFFRTKTTTGRQHWFIANCPLLQESRRDWLAAGIRRTKIER